jgi:hypothetical protein
MSMNDHLSEIFLAKEKVVTDPEHIFLALLREWNSGPNSGVDKEEIAARKRWEKAAKKLPVVVGETCCKPLRELQLFDGVGLDGRLQPVGH